MRLRLSPGTYQKHPFALRDGTSPAPHCITKRDAPTLFVPMYVCMCTDVYVHGDRVFTDRQTLVSLSFSYDFLCSALVLQRRGGA